MTETKSDNTSWQKKNTNSHKLFAYLCINL